ncbi:hypothetical protein MKX01_038707, partial [Papaver californicum]
QQQQQPALDLLAPTSPLFPPNPSKLSVTSNPSIYPFYVFDDSSAFLGTKYLRRQFPHYQ